MTGHSSHTFFVVAQTGLDGQPCRISTPDSEGFPPSSIEDIDFSMFPLCVVSVVFLAVRLRPFFE